MRSMKNSRRVSRRGLTMVEMLVALAILVVIMVGVAGLLETSWQSFSDLKWQNRVDSEARRALDAISDSVRVSGEPIDFYQTFDRRLTTALGYNIDPFSTGQILNLNNTALESYNQTSTSANVGYLARNGYYGSGTMAAVYIDSVKFAYEYREISDPGNTTWAFDTVQGLSKKNPVYDPTNGAIFYTVKTIYITVTASFNPYPNSIDSRTYTRTLTGAVTLRAPYNMPLPPAQIDGP